VLLGFEKYLCILYGVFFVGRAELMMEFREDVEFLGDLALMLLRKLDPEPVYVKKAFENACQEIEKEGWFKRKGEEPWVRVFEQRGYMVKIAFIHARKGEHITGADLAFELKDKKIIFVQSKRVDSKGRIHFNRFQLHKLIELEQQICGAFSIFLPPSQSSSRAVFYQLIMQNEGQVEERFFHISEIAFVLGSRKSVHQREFLNQGLKPHEFQDMFWKCKVGGPDIREDLKRDVFEFLSLVTNRLIIWLNVENTLGKVLRNDMSLKRAD
jgi:hypothetical protein